MVTFGDVVSIQNAKGPSRFNQSQWNSITPCRSSDSISISMTESRKRYLASEKGQLYKKRSRAKWLASEKGKARMKASYERQRAKRKAFGAATTISSALSF